MKRSTAKALRITAWIIVGLGVTAFTVLFWAYLGLAAVVLIPLVGLGAVVRALVNELRGKRPEYTVGTTSIAHLPERAEEIRHFTTRFPSDSDKG